MIKASSIKNEYYAIKPEIKKKYRNESNANKEKRVAQNKAKRLPINAHAPWGEDSDQRLISCFKKGISAEQIALKLERQVSAINFRLRKLKLI